MMHIKTTGIDIPSLQVVQDDQGFHVGQEDPENRSHRSLGSPIRPYYISNKKGGC